MPWKASDAKTHTKKAGTSKEQETWARVANKALGACLGKIEGEPSDAQRETCESSAIKQANAVIANIEERGLDNKAEGGTTKFTDSRQIAESALELTFATLTGETRLTQKQRLALAEALRSDLEALKSETVEETVMIEYGIEAEETPYVPYPITTFADLHAAAQTQAAANEIRTLTYEFKEMVSNIMFNPEVKDKVAALRNLTDEFTDLIAEKIGDVEQSAGAATESPPELETEEETPTESFTESASGVSNVADFTGDFAELGIEAAIESGRRAPVLVDFQIIEPGPGNKKDNRYYPRDMLRRDAPVFKGMDIFATDHLEKERSERTKVGRVQECPIRFTEDGAPVGRVIIYDPNQAEKTRNRADSDELATMEGSIFAIGTARAGKVDGKEYSVVEAITEGRYLELVSKAGAGGKALNLAESDIVGGQMMEDQKVAEEAPVEEVAIEEGEATASAEAEPVEEAATSEPVHLSEAEVEEALNKTNLPGAFKTALGKDEYADGDTLQKAIKEAITEVKALTGSGQVFGQGVTHPVTVSEADREAKATEAFNRIMNEVGLEPV